MQTNRENDAGTTLVEKFNRAPLLSVLSGDLVPDTHFRVAYKWCIITKKEFRHALEDADTDLHSASIESSKQVPMQPYWTQIVPVKGGARYRSPGNDV